MKLELLLHNNKDNNSYNLSYIADKITVKKSVDGTAGQLTCILHKDPNQKLNSIDKVGTGSAISFRVDDTNVFFGYIFKIGTDAEENYKITCYDSLRYLKNTNVYTFKTETASQIFEKVCQDFDLKYEVKTPISYIPPANQYLNKTLYQIIETGLQLASINDKVLYYIIDDYGTIKLSNYKYEGEQLSIQLGDMSVVNSFTYEKSIDEDTYNQVKLYRKNNTSGNIDTWIVFDSDKIKQWGVLQLFEQVNDKLNPAQIKEKAEQYLSVKNRETETLKIQAEGILECTAGKRLRFVYNKEGINKWMWIKSSTHTFTKEEHIMDLEVAI